MVTVVDPGDWSALGSAHMTLINQRGTFSPYLAQCGGTTGHSTFEIKGNWYLASLIILQSCILANQLGDYHNSSKMQSSCDQGSEGQGE